MSAGDECTWCGTFVGAGDGFRAYERAGARMAVFCRLEHVVPWGMRGAFWQVGPEAPVLEDEPGRCAHCDGPLGDRSVLLVRSRGEHRVPDGFCTVGHLIEWSKAGGRFAG